MEGLWSYGWNQTEVNPKLCENQGHALLWEEEGAVGEK